MATTTALTENSRQGINSEIPPCIGLGAWLSPETQRRYGHAYDETPAGIVVYVRNDPVNLVDTDGKDWVAIGNYSYWVTEGFFTIFSAVPNTTIVVTAEPPPPPMQIEVVSTFINFIRADSTNDQVSDCCGGGSPTLSQPSLVDPAHPERYAVRDVTIQDAFLIIPLAQSIASLSRVAVSGLGDIARNVAWKELISDETGAIFLQQSGNLITRRTAGLLNELFDKSLSARDWGRVVERLKDWYHISNNVHGSIAANGDYVIGNEIIDNLGSFIK